MSERDAYRLLYAELAAGRPAALATVVRTRGSTPREPGAKMVVTLAGSRGTVGGGCGEAEVLAVALELLRRGVEGRRLVRVDLTEEITESADRICGGVMDVLVEAWRTAHPVLRELADPPLGGLVRLLPVEEGGPEPGILLKQGAAPPDALRPVWKQVLVERRSLAAAAGQRLWFLDYVGTLPTVLICGAGHIAQPLCQLAKMLDHRVIVVDDRPEFAAPERFAGADQVVARPFEEALRALPIDRDTACVLVTRGHRHDELCLRVLLQTEAWYIGMLGSKRRVRAVFADLLREGYTPAQLARVWAPVGLDLGALTPAEIAVSIMAELVALRRGGQGGHLRLPPRAGRAS